MVLKKPHTLTTLVKNVECSSETVSRYISMFLKRGVIHKKSSRFSIFYNPEVEIKKIEFFEMLLNSTTQLVLKTLLLHNRCTQAQLEEKTGKSRSSICKSIQRLIQNNIVSKNYQIGYKSYSINDKKLVISGLKDTHQSLLKEL